VTLLHLLLLPQKWDSFLSLPQIPVCPAETEIHVGGSRFCFEVLTQGEGFCQLHTWTTVSVLRGLCPRRP
jgi:hypothetical protein